ncbi:MAG: ABC transporter permease [Candidatus Magnetobacterium sp. LHC-1]|uniref:Transport permease protein n=1 Tax=Candidatus Magnetobacterium casense TaxID=1455061 RepID=A0ABS6RZ10_9BACT|nr:ABC transporter permease [Candidatus Magnetobacterium casensis]MBF0608175.1 ABC transporter permease [Nitrospirota bacterium]MBV6341863.1 ABC transporter permease [Candidatus Magnetobacterium casensis]
MLNGLRAVLYREMTVFKSRAVKQLVTSSVPPLLFLIAFGWGLGKQVNVGGLPYISFLVPGLITMSALNQCFAISAEINISRFYFHTFDEYLIAPVSNVEIVLGLTIFGMFRGLLSTLIIFIYTFLFDVQLSLHPAFFVALTLHAFIFSALAVTTSMVVQDHSGQNLVTSFVITPMVFLCGTFFPVDKLPAIFKYLVLVLPLTYSTKVIRASLTGGTIEPLYICLLTLYCIIFFITAIWALKKVEA